MAARLKGNKTWTSEEWRARGQPNRANGGFLEPKKLRKPPFIQWWRGLDSNQRTLARADLQSAAFNHSATSPDCAGQMASASLTVNRNAGPCQRCRRVLPQPCTPGRAGVGAGEGN